jgi:hypothetical protein
LGSDNFFSKAASIDPLAQALDLPGAHKYAQSQAQDVQTNAGPYAGVTPTLAAANEGYTPGSTNLGAQPGWTPNQNTGGPGFFGSLQRIANGVGNTMPTHAANGMVNGTGGFSTGNPYVQQSATVNPYVTAAGRAAAAQGSG